MCIHSLIGITGEKVWFSYFWEANSINCFRDDKKMHVSLAQKRENSHCEWDLKGILKEWLILIPRCGIYLVEKLWNSSFNLGVFHIQTTAFRRQHFNPSKVFCSRREIEELLTQICSPLPIFFLYWEALTFGQTIMNLILSPVFRVKNDPGDFPEPLSKK